MSETVGTAPGGPVALVVNSGRPLADELAARARKWWEQAGYEVVEDRAEGAVVAALAASPAFVISFGGDGSLLRAVQATVGRGVPVLGVNLGTLGYLTEVEPDNLERAFARLVAGEFAIEQRMTLSVAVRRAGAEPDLSFIALNETTVERTAPGHTIRLAVEIDGEPFLTYSADGLIVATPTGSTAYNLSARGPVVSPELRVLVLTPIAPHLLFDRSMVLGPDATVQLRLLDGRKAALVVDGSNVVPLELEDTVVIGASPTDVPVVTFGRRRDFPAILRSKFALPDR